MNKMKKIHKLYCSYAYEGVNICVGRIFLITGQVESRHFKSRVVLEPMLFACGR